MGQHGAVWDSLPSELFLGPGFFRKSHSSSEESLEVRGGRMPKGKLLGLFRQILAGGVRIFLDR